MSQIQKVEGGFYCLLGLFMIIVLGGKLLLQLLGVACGAMLLFRGVRLLYPRQGHQQFFRFFQQQDRFF